MTDASTSRSSNTPPTKTRQRDPQTFSGTGQEDANDWLLHYERISKHNIWDDTIKLANVVFFLQGTALSWYDNHEEEINSWDQFTKDFEDVFGNSERRKQEAQERLSRRFQAATESSTAYIEDVLRLCRRVNIEMTEEDQYVIFLRDCLTSFFRRWHPSHPHRWRYLPKSANGMKHFRVVVSFRGLLNVFLR